MYDQLKQQINRLEKIMLGCPWEDSRFYGGFLAQTYYYVCHSTRLLALAASHLQVDRDDSHWSFAEHISEEKAHEQLAQLDLRALDLSLDQFPQLSLTRALYEAQYYKIDRQDPTSLFGFVLLLESAAAQIGPAVYERAKDAHGEKAVNFLRVHVKEDPGHVANPSYSARGISWASGCGVKH